LSRIVSIETGRFDYAFAGEFKFFRPDSDGTVRRPSVLLRLTDEDGRQGWGQAVPIPSWTYETVETIETTLSLYLAPILLGADPTDIDDVHSRMNQAIRPGFSVGQPLCKAAVDLACYDLVGKQKGQAVCQLLGGATRRALTLSWTIASPDMQMIERQLEEGRERGYRHFNIKVGSPQSPAYDLELARKVRAFAPDCFLWADANVGYSVETALDVLPRLADVGVDVMESPLPPNQIRGYQRLKRQGALPVLMDEGIISPVELNEFIALKMLDGVALKPARNAGIRPTWEIVNLLRAEGLLVLGSGLADPDLSLAASAHVFAWADIDYPCALNGPQFLADSLAGSALRPDRDQLTIPTMPGLGLSLDERAEAALTKCG